MRQDKLIRWAAIPLVMILYASTAKADLIAWYPLHGDATAMVGVDGDLINGPTPAPDEKGNPNGALNFQTDPNDSFSFSPSNTGSYVSVQGGGGLPGLPRGTIALWVNWSGLQGQAYTASKTYGPVLARQSNGKYSNNILGISDFDPNVGTLTWAPYNAGAPALVGGTPVGDNVWHFVAVTFDGTTGNQNLYLDGSLDGSPSAVTLNPDTSAPLTIGAWIGDGAGYSNSTIHDLYIFDTVLTQDQINTLKMTGMPPP
ncbi:MAG TPA: LamG domain-containing protein [Gemmataceae bacterium]|nr:LamG domain-containing protein [Gemmataceae bacterium]